MRFESFFNSQSAYFYNFLDIILYSLVFVELTVEENFDSV